MTSGNRNVPEFLMGLGIICIGCVIAFEAATIKVGPLYAKVGPAAFLWFAALLLGLCGAIVAWRAFGRPPDTGNEFAGPLTILAGLAVSVFLMEPVGFIPVATLIFLLTARGMGSQKPVRDLVVGLVLSAIAFVVFAWGLGLRLPVGVLFS